MANLFHAEEKEAKEKGEGRLYDEHLQQTFSKEKRNTLATRTGCRLRWPPNSGFDFIKVFCEWVMRLALYNCVMSHPNHPL